MMLRVLRRKQLKQISNIALGADPYAIVLTIGEVAC